MILLEGDPPPSGELRLVLVLIGPEGTQRSVALHFGGDRSLVPADVLNPEYWPVLLQPALRQLLKVSA